MLKFFGGGSNKGSSGPSKDQVRDLVRKLRREERAVEREIRQVEKQENEIKVELKKVAKQGHVEAAKALAKNIVQARKTKTRLFTARAQMESVAVQMQQSAAAARLATGMQESTEVMKAMQSLISVPECAAVARELSKEMTKIGILEEMMEDTFEDVLGDPEDESLADEEVEKVMNELTAGIMEKAPVAPISSVQPAPAILDQTEADVDDHEMHARLEALRS